MGPASPPGADPWGAVPEVPAAAPRSETKGWKQWAVAGGVAAVVAVAVGIGIGLTTKDSGSASTDGTAAAAADGQGAVGGQGGVASLGGRGAAGTISAIDGGTITLEAMAPPNAPGAADSGSGSTSGTATTITVETTGDTRVTESVEGSASDLQVGDNVTVVGTSTDDVISAVRVFDIGDDELPAMGRLDGSARPPADGVLPGGQPPFDTSADGTAPAGQAPAGELPEGAVPGGAEGQAGPGGIGRPTAGQITAIDGSTVTLETTDGTTVKVQLTDETTVTLTKDISLADLAEGDTISVQGEVADDTVIAETIRKGELGLGGGGPGRFPGAAPGATGDTTPATGN